MVHRQGNVVIRKAGLAYLASHSLPAAILVDGNATGGAVILFNTVIGQ
jgi:hypothetical protein